MFLLVRKVGLVLGRRKAVVRIVYPDTVKHGERCLAHSILRTRHIRAVATDAKLREGGVPTILLIMADCKP